jgi:hypothetical protein
MEDCSGFLENLADAYIREALEILHYPANTKDFETELVKRVSERLGFSEKSARYLYHVFHWSLFCDANNSPAGYKQAKKINEESRLVLDRDYNEDDINHLVNYTLEKYSRHLEARIRSSGCPENLLPDSSEYPSVLLQLH